MSLAKIKHIPFLIKKLGDGEYRIKIKEGKIQIFSKNKRYENEEIGITLHDAIRIRGMGRSTTAGRDQIRQGESQLR